MACCPPQGILFDAMLALNRLTLGLLFLLAGYAKVFTMGIEAFYQKAFTGLAPPWLPSWFAYAYGHAVPVLEVLVGLGLIAGLLTRLTAAGAALMLASFTVALVVKSGSLGGGTPAPFHANFILLSLALLLAGAGAGRFSLDRLAFGRGGSRA